MSRLYTCIASRPMALTRRPNSIIWRAVRGSTPIARVGTCPRELLDREREQPVDLVGQRARGPRRSPAADVHADAGLAQDARSARAVASQSTSPSAVERRDADDERARRAARGSRHRRPRAARRSDARSRVVEHALAARARTPWPPRGSRRCWGCARSAGSRSTRRARGCGDPARNTIAVAHRSTVHGPTPLSVVRTMPSHTLNVRPSSCTSHSLTTKSVRHAARAREQPRGHRADHLDVAVEHVRRVDEHVAAGRGSAPGPSARARSRAASPGRRRGSGTDRAGRTRTSRRPRRRRAARGASRRPLRRCHSVGTARASGQSSSSRQRLTPCTKSRTAWPVGRHVARTAELRLEPLDLDRAEVGAHVERAAHRPAGRSRARRPR